MLKYTKGGKEQQNRHSAPNVKEGITNCVVLLML